MFWFSLQLLSEAFLTLRRLQRYFIINVLWSLCKVSVILVRFSRQIFERYSNIKFHGNLFSKKLSCSMRTDGRTHDEVIVAFGNFANAPKNTWMHPVAKCAASDLSAHSAANVRYSIASCKMNGSKYCDGAWSNKRVHRTLLMHVALSQSIERNFQRPLRFASSVVSHYAPHTRSITVPRIHVCISHNFRYISPDFLCFVNRVS